MGCLVAMFGGGVDCRVLRGSGVWALMDLSLGLEVYSLSLQSLALGYEYGRVFPAGAGPGSPSRNYYEYIETF